MPNARIMRRLGGAPPLHVALIVAGITCAIAAAGLTVRAFAADPRVTIANFTFSPGDLTVPVGTTVVFDNDDDIPHTVVATDRSFRSQALDTTDEFRVTLTKAGEIDYFCSLHPRMTGKIIVTP